MRCSEVESITCVTYGCMDNWISDSVQLVNFADRSITFLKALRLGNRDC